MNLFIGYFSSIHKIFNIKDTNDKIYNKYKQKSESFISTTYSEVSYIKDNNVMCAVAQFDDISLLLLGSIHLPISNWNDKDSPVDNAHKTAKYLLNSYIVNKNDFLNGIYGHYSVIIYDRKKDAFFLGGDPHGYRPIYIYKTIQGIAFSTNINLLASALGNRIKPNRTYESFLLTYSFIPFNQTFYSGIETLPKGELLKWTKNQLEYIKISSENPWKNTDLENIEWDSKSESQAIDILYNATMQAHEDLCTTNKNVGVLLGGVDSALVASVLQRLGKKVSTYSFYYSDNNLNQPYTDTLANYLGINHNWINIDSNIIKEGIDKYELFYNQASNWAHYPIQTTYLVSKMKEHGIDHCYSGDGCDGVFLGYPRTHTMASLMNVTSSIPNSIFNTIAKIINIGFIEKQVGRPYRVLMHVLRNLSRHPPQRGFLTFGVFDVTSISRLRKNENPNDEINIEEIILQLTGELKGMSPDRLAYLGKSMSAVNITKLNGAESKTGVPIFSPYLHPGYVEIAKSIPVSLLRPEGDKKTTTIGKYLFLRMIEEKKLLPQDVIYQKKISAVDAPVDKWYQTEIESTIRNQIKMLPFKTDQSLIDNLMRKKFIEKLYSRYISSDQITAHEISLLATYAAYMKEINLS